MVLIFLGLLTLIIVGVITRSQPQAKRFAPVGRAVALVLMTIGILTACVVQIDAGEAGVKVLFGKVQNQVLGSGLHFINPLIDVRRIDVRTQNYTMSGVNDEGSKSGDDAIKVLTSDGRPRGPTPRSASAGAGRGPRTCPDRRPSPRPAA